MNFKNSILPIIVFSIIFANNLSAQNISLTGKVFDEGTGLPLEGVIVSISGLNKTTSSNVLGEFELSNLMTGDYSLTFRYIGYNPEKVTVTVPSMKATNLVVYLKSNPLNISEIEVTSNIDYGKISFESLDMQLRPVNTTQDLLRLTPGLFIAQHAGGGKAEQLFLRGFDIDHGTDINILVDGLPVNMTSHAHGQGYADLHFVIPETINEIDVYKGPYFSKFGDFGTSGSVVFNTMNTIEQSYAKVELGKFNTYRGLLMLNILGKKALAKTNELQSLYLASEYTYSDGFVDDKQKFSRVNIFAKYFAMLSRNSSLDISGSTFNSHWNASGQIPSRAVENNFIGRFGSIDNTEGGSTFRTNASITLTNSFGHNASLANQIFYSRYGFNLYSNFTFFLSDSLNGDMIQQYEKRNIFGYNGTLTFNTNSGNANLKTDIGAGFRIVDIDTIFLADSYQREFEKFKTVGKILQEDFFAYVNENIEFENFVINPGVRADYFDFKLTDYLSPENSGSKTALRLSPKLNVFYDVSQKTQLYIKSGIGFHSNDARVVVVEKNENTLPLAVGYETGVSFTVGNALVNTGVWGLALESEFVYVGDEGVVEAGGRTRRFGFDFSGRYQFNKWLWADLDLNYTHGRFIDEPEDADRIPLAPVFTSVGGVSFKLQNGLNGRLGYRFIDDRPANETYSVTANGYFLMDAVLNFTADKYSFGFSVDNLLDNKNWNEAQFDTESRLSYETDPVSELHFTPGNPFYLKGNISLFF